MTVEYFEIVPNSVDQTEDAGWQSRRVMIATRFPLLNGFCVVGEPPMILSGDYHPDQGWFSFMVGSIFRKTEAVNKPVNDISYRRHTGRVRILAQHWAPYIYEKGVPQIVLPFAEFKRVSNAQWMELWAADCPGWERNNAGQVLCLKLSEPKHNIQKWCEENCAGRFKMYPDGVILERISDYILTKLRFG